MTRRFFTSWVRRGAAAGITEIDQASGAYAGPATFNPAVVLAKDANAQPSITGPALQLLGPGVVVSMSPRQVVRTDPAPGATGVEDNFLVLAELARPDLPWLFTPASAGPSGRLRPWIVLVVLEADKAPLTAGSVLPSITVTDADLPDLNDAWAWAHTQATVDSDDPAIAAAALTPPSGGNAVARLLCPMRLAPDTAYLACLVPATLVGLEAGLGLPLDSGTALAPAWTAGANQAVTLPVFYSWTFSTGDRGDFKSLVERLQGVAPDTIAGFGTRTIDLSAPWTSDPQLGAGMTIELDGALGMDGVNRPGTITDAARSAFETRLTALVNFPSQLQPADPAGDPSLSCVAPPLYAGRYSGQVQIPAADGWLRSLNLEPRRRIAAHFGTRFVQDHQEFLMARAWDQLGAVLEANKLRAQAQLASEVADRLHLRHMQTRTPSELFSVAAPARTRVVMGGLGTLQATVSTTALPAGAGTVAFTRMVRPGGPLGQRAFKGAPSALIVKALGNSLGAESAPILLDGLSQAPATAPRAGQITTDATGILVSTAWKGMLQTEASIPGPGDITTLRTIAINTAGKRPTGVGFVGSAPVILETLKSVTNADPATLTSTLLDQLVPSSRILRRLAARTEVPDSYATARPADRIMAYPSLTAPLALPMIQEHPEYLIPGLGNFPDDRVTVMNTNGAFIEAYLAGANQEMNREMLWRGYPADQRGTPFQHFWPRPDGQPDLPPITQWPLANALGSNGAANGPDAENMVVLLVRGEVLRRFPRTLVYAAPGIIQPDGTFALNTGVDWTPALFLLALDAKTTIFAFALPLATLYSNPAAAYAGIYFVFSEPVTGPRFNFDEPTNTPPATYTDLAWNQIPTARGFAVAGRDLQTPLPAGNPGDPTWNHDASDTARMAYSRPFRIAYHADQLLPQVTHG